MEEMKLQKVDVAVWVKASEEPTVGDYYLCKVDTKSDCISETIVEWGQHSNGEYKYFDWDLQGVQHFPGFSEDAEVIEWLKPLPDRYLLTEDELEKIKNADKWISVKDKLPKKTTDFNASDKWVLCCTGLGSCLLSLCYYDHKSKNWYDNTNPLPETRITHWQSLPSPPKNQ